MKIAFPGLGTMGLPMTKQLVGGLALLGDRMGPLTAAALARLDTTPPDAELGVLADPQGRP